MIYKHPFDTYLPLVLDTVGLASATASGL